MMTLVLIVETDVVRYICMPNTNREFPVQPVQFV